MIEMTKVEVRKRRDFSIRYDHLRDCLVLFDGKKKIQHRVTFNLLVKRLLDIKMEELKPDD